MSAATCWNCGQAVQGPGHCTACGALQTAGGALATPVPPGRPGTPAAGPSRVRRPAPGDLGPTFRGKAAAPGARLAAFSLDAVAVALAGSGAYLAGHSVVLAAVVAAEVVAALLVWEARTGLTIGNGLLRLRTARADRPWSPGVGRQAARAVVVGLGALAALVGAWVVAASGAWDATGRRRTWADRVAGTVVVAVPRRAPAVRAVPLVAPGLTLAVPPAQPLVMAAAAPVAPSAAGAGVPAPPEAPFAPAAPPAPAGPLAPSSAPAAASPAPAAASPAPLAPVQPEVSLLLVLDTGQRAAVPLGTAAVLGRSPSPAEPLDQPITVRDDEGTVSKNHLRLEHARDGVWLTDLGSTNGTHLVDEDGSTRLPSGTRVALGDGVRVRVGRRAFTVSVVVREG